MIRTKAKTLLLSIMLIMACGVFFACKKTITTISVESISFSEKSISLLVDDEYIPTVKVLPSYATVRSYTLISNDVTALSVEGGTIKALKPALGVKLKVVSDDNKNLNDVISVDIYEDARDLDTPTELNFDGNKFTFVGKDNVDSYVLKIDGEEINIGNNLEYSFDSVLSKISGLHNRVVTCSVKSVGDGKVFNDSAYCEEISFVKLSNVENAYVENEILYFDGIKDVASYDVEVYKDAKYSQTLTVYNDSFKAKQLSLDISHLTNSVDGAEYEFRILSNIEGYNSSNEVAVFGAGFTRLAYVVLGKVQNVTIAEKVISWDFVKNTQSYNVEVYKDGELLQQFSNITTNHMTLPFEDEGNYSCKVIANSNKANTTSGKEYSNILQFSILPAPTILMNNNSVYWNEVEGGEGYLVTIKNSSGAILVDQKFVIGTQYDVSSFGAGTYCIELVACGNGENGQSTAVTPTISSVVSEGKSWIVLQNFIRCFVENETIYWQDWDSNSLNTYLISFDGVEKILTEQNLGTDFNYDSETKAYSYKLSSHSFEPGEYTINVQSLGVGNVFDAESSSCSIVKLEQSSVVSLNNCKFTIQLVQSASLYQIEVYNTKDLQTSIMTFKTNSSTVNIDASQLEAGEYLAKVYTYGNGENVFDADEPTSGLSFKKLAIPSVEIDGSDLKVTIVDNKNASTDVNSYKLFENSNVKNNLVDNQYDLSVLSAGEYTYTVQAIGNGANVLDSEITLIDNVKKVKKLSTPTISFDKETLKFTISCGADESYASGYTMLLGDKNVPVVNNVAQLSQEDVNNVGDYSVNVVANPKLDGEYNLIIASNAQNYSITKLNGVCGFEISNGTLIVTPNTNFVDSGYSLVVNIDNGEGGIVLDQFSYTSSRFIMNLLDSEYNAIEAISSIMQGSGEYLIYTTISQNKDNVITSNKTQCSETLKVLGKVTTISKNGQNIEFNSVDGATNYVAIVEVQGVEYYVDIVQAENVLPMSKLIGLMENAGVPYLEQVEYKISFVAISNDSCTLNNKGQAKYSFEFLKTPNICVVENDDNSKRLSIANEDINTFEYYIEVNQNDALVVSTEQIKSAEDTTIIDVDEIAKDTVTNKTKLVAGNVNIVVKATATAGDYFDSKNGVLNVVKLDSPTVTIENGKLVWNVIPNAKQYNLTYSNLTTNTLVLTEGVENFTVNGDKCVYDFDDLISGTSALYVQVDANLTFGGTYYFNSNNGEVFDMYKLQTPEISVVSGKVYLEFLNYDLDRTDRVDVKVDDQTKLTISAIDGAVKVVSNGIDLVELDDGSVILTPKTNSVGITLAPEILCEYGDVEILKETITVKMYSKDSKTLNSSMDTKEVYGLLSPTHLDITTSTTINENGVIDEVFEKISWSYPESGKQYVNKYEIILTYKEVDYIFYTTTIERIFTMPTYYAEDANENEELDYDEDVNGNGILDDGEDVNGNGILDKVEQVFGAGQYSIKVKALTYDNEQYLNSRYCAEIMVTILETPIGIATEQGNIVWNDVDDAGYYLIKIYLMDGQSKELEISTQSNVCELDLTKLNPMTQGVYGISVQAMNNNSRILASKESKIFQVIRLPQVSEYYLKDGALYIRVHKFYTKAEIYLTEKETGNVTYRFPIQNQQDEFNIETYVLAGGFKTWSSSDIISTYSNDDYYIDVRYELDEDVTLLGAFAEDYNVTVKLLGNSISSDIMLEGMSIGGIISSHISQANNTYFEQTSTDKNVIEKLVKPTMEVSSTERGVVLMTIPKGVHYSLKYYMNGGKSLQGVHLYQINLMVNNSKTHVIYVADVINQTLLEESIGGPITQDGADKNYLKHFEYNGITFNVISRNAEGYIPFDLNGAKYFYYEPVNKETNQAGGYIDVDLTAGGNYVLNARFMGDDSIFAQSDITDIVTIKRYDNLSVEVKEGSINWINQATINDNPMYIITLTSSDEKYNVVLYNPQAKNELGQNYTEEYLLASLDSSQTYIFDTIYYDVNAEVRGTKINYNSLADIIDTARARSGNVDKIGLGGTFLTSIKAYYTNATSKDIVLAQGGATKHITILPQAPISVVDGTLTWTMSYVGDSEGGDYAKNYLLQIFDGTDTYEIILETGMYNVSNNIATYQLTRVIGNDESGQFRFNAGADYTFNIIALGDESNTYINSISSTTGQINLLPDIEDVRMENGVLTWTNNTVHGVEIYVSYTVGDTEIVYKTVEYGNQFVLPRTFRDTNGTFRYFIAGQDYYIRVRLKGYTTTLNGFFNDDKGGEVVDSDKIIAQRLETINIQSIATNKGVLTWNKVNKDGVKYTVVYTLADGTTATTEMLEANAFDFAGLLEGVITVKIFAHHNNHFTSFASNTDEFGNVDDTKLVELFKLSKVSEKSIKYHQGSTIISWDKVQDGRGNYVNNYRVSIRQEGMPDKEYDCNANEWAIVGVSGTSFSIAVKAISVETAGTIISSDYTEYCSMELPNQVDVTTFEFDEELQAFKWKAIVGEQEGDRYYIGYNYYENNSQDSVTAKEFEVTTCKEIDGEKYYFYYPSVIGSYRLIYVQVKRAESLSSQKTYCMKDASTTYALDFDLFASGEGTSAKPYIIVNEEQLRNVKYFLNAYYEMFDDVVLTSNTAITTYEQVFTGSIKGNGYYIKGVTETLTEFNESGYVALFEKVQGAKFENIGLSGFNIKGYVMSENLYLGLLVGVAESNVVKGTVVKSTFKDITVISSSIEIVKTKTKYNVNSVKMYVGGIVGYATECQFIECMMGIDTTGVNIYANIEGNAQTKLSVGSMAGYGDNCSMTGNTSNNTNAFVLSAELLIAEGSGKVAKVYVGVMIGEVGDVGVDIDTSSNSCKAEYFVGGLKQEIAEIGK